MLYTVNEPTSPTENGSVVCLQRNADGEYSRKKALPSAGSLTCHLTLLPQRRLLCAVNSGSANLSLYSLEEDGTLAALTQQVHFEGSGPIKERQETPHPHQSKVSPDGNELIVSDLGSDRLHLFDVGTGAPSLTCHRQIPLPAGSGPRHMAWSADGRRLYLLAELSATVFTFAYDANGLSLLQGCSPYPASTWRENLASEIVCGKGRVYTANRGYDTISVFEESADGLRHLRNFSCQGKHPRHFAILPGDGAADLMVVANQHSHALAFFAIYAEDAVFFGAFSPFDQPFDDLSARRIGRCAVGKSPQGQSRGASPKASISLQCGQ